MGALCWSVALVLTLCAAQSRALVDPHVEGDPDRCLRCHTKVPAAEEARAGQYHLIMGSIDATCLLCHVKSECCSAGQAHLARPVFIGISHGSDVDVRDIPKSQRPKTLPVQNGKITCSTCHVHDRQRPVDYKLVRLITVRDTGIDWSRLCADYHPKY